MIDIHWVHPNRIRCSTQEYFNLSWQFSILDGDWDHDVIPIEDMLIYACHRELFVDKKPWIGNSLRKHARIQLSQGIPQWDHRTLDDFEKREAELRNLYNSIAQYGVRSQRELLSDMPCCNLDGKFSDEITVGIGRHGNLILFNGYNRICIAKILKLDKIPVRIIRVHKIWDEFYKQTLSGCASIWGEGVCYHQIDHISFDLLVNNWSSGRADLIKKNINRQYKTVLDIGSLFGYFCTQLEDTGFCCTAVENHKPFLEILLKIKEAGYFNFDVIEQSVFDLNDPKFDVVLAFNIFHHFLKTQAVYEAFKAFLKRLKTREMFVQLHDKNERQMDGAYKNYDNGEFLRFISSNVGLTNVHELDEENGRKIFKLT
jgi:hypothetical protein